MKNAHYETDAQNWHIVGTELFNDKFHRKGIRVMRIYLHQPSPVWLDYNIRSVQVFRKKPILPSMFGGGL